MLKKIVEVNLSDYFQNFELDNNIIYMDVKEEYYNKIHDIFNHDLPYINQFFNEFFIIDYEELGTFMLKIKPNIKDLNKFKQNVIYLKRCLDRKIND